MQTKKMTAWLLVLGLCALPVLAGCAPPQLEQFVEVETNETAFVVPMEGATKSEQGHFMSTEYLEANKAATKRIPVPTRWRSTGRTPIDGEWIPTVRVIRINRMPVTREWTKQKTTGTSPKDEAIYVESLDSIGFGVGVNVTAFITENDAAKFLYYYAGADLAKIIDENVRSFVQSTLGREFGKRSLADCKKEKSDIFLAALKETREEFSSRGISIANLGHAEGLIYEDREIQQAINAAYVAEMSIKTADQERLAQEKRNEQLIATATAERQAAEEFAKAKEAQVAKIELEIEKIRADAVLVAANRWNGAAPSSIVPAGSGFLFGLDTGKASEKH